MLHRSANEPLTDRIQIEIAKDVSFPHSFFFFLREIIRAARKRFIRDSSTVGDFYCDSLRNFFGGIFSRVFRDGRETQYGFALHAPFASFAVSRSVDSKNRGHVVSARSTLACNFKGR